MPRREQSEVFEAYIKTLEEKGIIKSAQEEKESKELKHYKEDPNAKIEGRTVDDIAGLYGIRPDSIYEYERSIMEIAHPNSLIISPAYDNLNGLIENNIERGNIMSNIALKPTNGNHTNHKYASKELMFELVRLANEMDATNNEPLRKQADRCIALLAQKEEQIKKKLKKQGLAPLVIVGLTAAALGALWLSQHTSNVDHGLLPDADDAIAQLNDLKTNSWYESDVDGTVQQETDNLIDLITKLKGSIVKFQAVSNMIYKPRTLTELAELTKTYESAATNKDEIAEAVLEFKKTFAELGTALNQAIDNFSSSAYQKEHTTPSTIGKMTGWLGEALHGAHGLIGNDFISAVNSLKTLRSSLEENMGRLKNLDKVIEQYKGNIHEALDNAGLNQDGTNKSEVVKSNSNTPKENENSEKSWIGNKWESAVDAIKGTTHKDPTKEQMDFMSLLEHLNS